MKTKRLNSSPCDNEKCRRPFVIPHSSSGYSLIEMLVYGAVLVIIMGVSYAALYRCTDTSVGLRRNTSDIAEALRAGEDWRADVREATAPIRFITTNDEQIIEIPMGQKNIGYRFAGNTVYRRIGSNDWSPLLEHVKSSAFSPETRHDVTAWHWEIELQMRTKKFTQTPPLFSFMAVPVGGSSK